MLRLTSFSLSTAAQSLLDTVDATLVEGERVGLVGPNGSGKSTLLRSLSLEKNELDGKIDGELGEEPYFAITSGHIHGSLSPKDREPGSVLLVGQDCLSWRALFPTVGSEEEMLEMTVSELLEAAVVDGGYEAMEEAETWRRLTVAADVALGWNTAKYDKTPIGRLSPGSARRAFFAIALHRPTIKLLLLDEPTNHLDLPSVLWLQHTILASKKTVVMVSHDESFLDAVVDRIWDINSDDYSLTVSVATYTDYKRFKLLAIELQRKQYLEQQLRHQHLSEAANQLKKASKRGEFYMTTDHAKLQRDFKRERAGRSGRRAAAVEKRLDMEEKIEAVVERTPFHLRLSPVGSGLDSSILLDSVSLGYSAGSTQPLSIGLPLISLRVDFGERVAFVGYNGIGKSTLLNTITKTLEPLSGSVHVGRELVIGSLTQEHESLPRSSTPRDYISALCNLDRFTAGSRVISYGLTLHQVDSPIEELNPGARVRLILATFSFRRVNVLILDEPTNHLDDEAMQEVVFSLNSFEGTIIVVSHSRDLLNSLKLNRCFRLSVEGLSEIESVDSFVQETEALVEQVVKTSFS